MIKVPITPENEFQKLFQELTTFQFQTAKARIIDQCCISMQTFNNWWKGSTSPKQLYIDRINSIIDDVKA